MNVEPDVFLTNSDINTVIDEFSLNPEQTRAFRIICNHALRHYLPQDPQLLLGVFGAGGTGKSTLIEALRVWFRRNNRDSELIVTATLWQRRCQNRWHHDTHGRFHPNRNSRREKGREVKGEADQRLERSPIHDH